MKKLPLLLIALSCTALLACSKGQEINAQNIKTAYRSVKVLKERLPAESRIEFEVSFWTIRDANRDDNKFLDIVDGKKPQEIIELGKEVYEQRKNAGYKGYEQYSSWGEMITKFGRERIDQDNRKGNKKEVVRDKANDILYKL
ncbi:MAG: hypothetical protein WAW36_02455 [Methylovulum miyakonense]|uniref:hypothetical protein n=1 Tax=Methylovulum miyakonense TaxID=645578 RepID=UPI003BB4B62C